MALTVIIPAKANSTRVAAKNFRPFWEGRSLVDLLIEKLLRAGIDQSRIVLSTESVDAAAPVVERWGVRFAQRNPRLCENETPFADVFRGVLASCDRIGATDPDSEILWAQCIDPLFDDYAAFIAHWERHKRPTPGAALQYDSARVIYPHRGYRLDRNKRPVGWGFGPWHVPSQRLEPEYLVSFTASILTRQCIEEIGYYWGRHVLDFEADGHTIDIDTPEDFQIAADVVAARRARGPV